MLKEHETHAMLNVIFFLRPFPFRACQGIHCAVRAQPQPWAAMAVGVMWLQSQGWHRLCICLDKGVLWTQQSTQKPLNRLKNEEGKWCCRCRGAPALGITDSVRRRKIRRLEAYDGPWVAGSGNQGTNLYLAKRHVALKSPRWGWADCLGCTQSSQAGLGCPYEGTEATATLCLWS